MQCRAGQFVISFPYGYLQIVLPRKQPGGWGVEELCSCGKTSPSYNCALERVLGISWVTGAFSADWREFLPPLTQDGAWVHS